MIAEAGVCESGDEYWISGPRKDGHDRLYCGSNRVIIDDDVKEEYWTSIRGTQRAAAEPPLK